jgi:CRISPR-associated protein Csm3
MIIKLEISGKIEVVSGLHIGASDAYSAIGAIDSPVIRDPKSGDPIIPGSSLKGKLRTLLAKLYNEKMENNRNADHQKIKELFGSSDKGGCSGRLLFSDMLMSNWDELQKRGARTKTEVKFENTINRVTAVANPRQIERVIRGAIFDLSIIYDIEYFEKQDNEEGKLDKKVEIVKEHFQMLRNGFDLLEYDYLGGSGSRGYGKIKLTDLAVKSVFDVFDKNDSNKKKLNDLLNECHKTLNPTNGKVQE